MTAKTALGLTYPLSSDPVLPYQHIQQLAADLDALLTMPAEALASSLAANTITSTSTYAALPTPVSTSMTNPRSDRSLLCLVNYAAWLISNGAETRMSLNATGSNVWSAGSAGPGGTAGPQGYGESVVTGNLATTGNAHGHGAFTMTIPPSGVTTLEIYATRLAAGTSNQVALPTLRITPLRYV